MKQQQRTTGKAHANPKPKQAKPTPEQIEEALHHSVDNEIDQYLCELEIARRVYRSNPELVVSKAFPEPWLTLYAHLHEGRLPDDHDTQEAPTIVGLRKKLLPIAIQVADGWANKSTKAA